jgi:hypothetical protein
LKLLSYHWRKDEFGMLQMHYTRVTSVLTPQ